MKQTTTDEQAIKQTTNKHKQTDKQAHKQSRKETNKQASKQTNTNIAKSNTRNNKSRIEHVKAITHK